MSIDTHAAHAIEARPYQTPSNLKMAALGLTVVGAALLGYGIVSEPWRGWSNALIGAYFATSLAFGALVIVALMYVAKAGWGIVVRRVPEAMAQYMPVALLTMLAVTGLGMHELYEWSHPEIVAKDHLLQHKQPVLNPGAFFGGMIAIIGIWSLFAFLIRRNSVAQDSDAAEQRTHTNVRLSGGFLVFFGVSVTVGALQWLMSLEPHWFSTMFGVYHFAGAHVAAAAAVTLLVIFLMQGGFLPQANENHLHDLGKMMFAFSTFWAYIWVSQFLLIWYANVPEETGYYMVREEPGWFALFALNVIVRWGIPFFALLPRPNKRNPKVLVPVACIVLFGQWLDVYLQVMPATSHFAAHHTGNHDLHGPFLGLPELGGLALFSGLFLLVVSALLGKAALVPKNDPYLVESLHHHQ